MNTSSTNSSHAALPIRAGQWPGTLVRAAAVAVGAALMATSVASAQDSGVTRVLPSSVLLGEPFIITIDASSAAGTWGVTEQVPFGYTVERISHGGRFVPGMSQVHWGPFNDVPDQPLSFRLIPTHLGLGGSVVVFGAPDTGFFDDPNGPMLPLAGPDRIQLPGPFFPVIPPTAPPGPFVITHPVDQTVGMGRTATFLVSAAGTAPLSYQWFHNGRPIPGATEPSRILREATRANRGYYYVIVTDADGLMTVSRPVLLTVTDPSDPPPGPIVTAHPRDQVVVIGRAASFSVIATGATPLSYQWFRNGLALAGETGTTLNVLNLTQEDAGTYYVSVTDSAGRVTLSHAAVLNVSLQEPFTITRSQQPHLREIYNLAGSYTDHFEFDEAEATVEYSLAHNQYGRLTGGGQVIFTSPAGVVASDLQVHGNIRRLGDLKEAIYRVTLILRAGQGEDFSMVLTQVMEVDATHNRLVGEVNGRVVIGEDEYALSEEAHETGLPPGRDGDWTLTITPSPLREGQGEAVLLVQGDELRYEVTQRYLPLTNVEIYHLRGVGIDSRGSNIRVDTDAFNTVVRMFGQAKGQQLHATKDP